MTTLDDLKTALQAREGISYITQHDAYYDGITDAVVDVGAGLVATSTTAATIGTGAQSLTVQAEKNFAAGQLINVYQTSAPSNYMLGRVTSYDKETGALAFTADGTNGSGTISDWTVTLSGPRGETGETGGTAGGTLAGDLDAAGFDITNVDDFSVATGTVTTLTATTATTEDATADDATIGGLTTLAEAGEHEEGNPTDVSGDVILQATGPAVIRNTLTGDTTYLVAGAPTPGEGWAVELRTTQDGTGSRDVTILPVNELTYSDDLQSTAEAGETRPWIDTNTSLDANAAVGPDGRTTLTKLIEDAVSGSFIRLQAIIGLAPNQTLTGSVVVKDAGDSRNVRIYLSNNAATGNRIDITVNPATGAIVAGPSNVGNATGATAVVTALDNDCFRVDITGQPDTSGSDSRITVFLVDGANSTYTGDGTSGVLVGRVQVVKGQPGGMAKVGATRAGQVVWRIASDEIDYAAQSASTESRVLITPGSDGQILIDDLSLS